MKMDILKFKEGLTIAYYELNIITIIVLLLMCFILYKYINNSIQSIRYNLNNNNRIEAFVIFIIFMCSTTICNYFIVNILYLWIYALWY